ncbi:MAG: hypothetical protein FGM24_07250 [Candidatus Kapabacteria bacterium]|nr:hypothetical protein [Candidatus Kapabacteria bacterium]
MGSRTKSTATRRQRDWRDPRIIASVLFIIVLTVLSYQPIFDVDKQFVNWDDDDYITEQPLVQSVKGKNITRMFDTETHVSANYHPLTMLSLAMDIDRGGQTMRPFMQTNLALHVLNAVFVFIMIYMLFGGSVPMALTVAMLFAVHPMHVESVAWASARKDVLYAFFYLLACISYLRYTTSLSWVSYAVTIVLFVLSCWSKPMAVTLPVVLLAVDAYLGRMSLTTARPWIEKLPLFGISLYFGVLTFSIQSSTSTGLVDASTYSLVDRLAFAGYGVLQYAYKLLLPVNMSAFYPYPSELMPGNVPAFMYVGAGVVLMAIIGTLLAWYRWRTPVWNTIAFGVALYLITASLVLQVISVGGASMADRYTYIPYLGFFILLGLGVHHIAARVRSASTVLVSVAAVGVFLGLLTADRIRVWENSETLWTGVIDQYPYEFSNVGGNDVVIKRGALYAYSNRGIHYIKTNQLEKGAADLAVLSRAKVTHPDSYRAYGVVLQRLSRHAEAINAFSTAIAQGDVDYQVYRARGASYSLSGQPELALADYAVALRKQPGDQLTLQAVREAQAMMQARQAAIIAP